MSETTTRTVAAAKPPVGVGATPLVAQLLALGLVALGVVGVQDLLARTGLLGQAPWLDRGVEQVEGVPADSPWVLVGGIVAVVLGVLLLSLVLRRRPRTTIELRASTGVRLRTPDLPRLVRDPVEAVDGVIDVDVRATRRTLRVDVATAVPAGERDRLQREVQEQLRHTLDALEDAPRTKIRLKEASS